MLCRNNWCLHVVLKSICWCIRPRPNNFNLLAWNSCRVPIPQAESYQGQDWANRDKTSLNSVPKVTELRYYDKCWHNAVSCLDDTWAREATQSPHKSTVALYRQHSYAVNVRKAMAIFASHVKTFQTNRNEFIIHWPWYCTANVGYAWDDWWKGRHLRNHRTYTGSLMIIPQFLSCWITNLPMQFDLGAFPGLSLKFMQD